MMLVRTSSEVLCLCAPGYCTALGTACDGGGAVWKQGTGVDHCSNQDPCPWSQASCNKIWPHVAN
eukprot:4448534-Amphidinium_carterae.2